MSSHVLDLSGQRQMQLTINDPATTRMWAPAKTGDDGTISISAREIRIPLGGNVRVQKRLATVKKPVKVDGQLVKKDGDYVYEEATEERLMLVFPGSLSGFIRSSLTPDQRALEDGTEGKPYEQHTSTTVQMRRRKDDEWDWSEAGELLEEHQIAEMLERAADVAQGPVVSFEEAQRIMAEEDGDPLAAIPARTITKAQAAMNAALTACKGLDDPAFENVRTLCREALEGIAART